MLKLKSISVKNWGPINEAHIELADVTVIIGPQNSGKTYLATLSYIMYRDMGRIIQDAIINTVVDVLGEKGYRGYVSSEK